MIALPSCGFCSLNSAKSFELLNILYTNLNLAKRYAQNGSVTAGWTASHETEAKKTAKHATNYIQIKYYK